MTRLICPLSTGFDVTFVGTDGTPYRREVVAASRVGTTDIVVYTLGPVTGSTDPNDGYGTDGSLPSAYIHPIRLLPDGFENYSLTGSAAMPVVFTTQDKRLLLGQYAGTEDVPYHDGTYPDEVRVNKGTNAAIADFYYALRGGDSGSPAMVLVNGELALMTCWHGSNFVASSWGPNHADHLTAIQDAINANAVALSIAEPYIVYDVDLTGFTNYSALLA